VVRSGYNEEWRSRGGAIVSTQLSLPDYDTRDREGGDNFVASPSRITDADAAFKFITAGNAYFTVRSVKTGTRYTFRVSLPRNEDRKKMYPASWFVALLTGPDNTGDYTYLGLVKDGAFKLTRASKMREDSVPVRAFRYVYEHLARKQFPADLELWHEGRCGRCGRKLTVPESIDRGIGPECASIMGGAL
jgi:hypothetical protein